MALAMILYDGEDLTDGKGVMIDLTKVREIEKQGFVVILPQL